MALPTNRYSPQQTKAVLDHLGIKVVSSTSSNYLCYCPFHGNRDTPAFSIDKYQGGFLCFNAACGAHGTLAGLVRYVTDCNPYQAMRFIDRYYKEIDIEEEVQSTIFEQEQEEWEHANILPQLEASLWESQEAQDYMHNRGFADDALKHFGVGYSPKQKMITVPVYSWNDIAVGIVGRSIEGKRFKNATGMPRNSTIYNLNRVRRMGPEAIIVESSFDVIYLWQLGYDNAVALLGGYVSDDHAALLDRHFDTIYLMTDFDKKEQKKNCRVCKKGCIGHRPGRKLAYSIKEKLPNKQYLWPTHSTTEVYPHEAKDPLDMQPGEVRNCIENAMSDLEYDLAFGPNF